MKTRLKLTLSQTSGFVGASMLVFVLLVAFLGRFVAPHDPTDPISFPGQPPGMELLLGSDYLGRDVLSRVLYGGTSVILIGLSATLLAYLFGILLGMVAGYVGGWAGGLIMRAVDISLAFPPLLVLLLLVGGLQPHIWVLILGVVLVQIPGVTRVTRAATASVARCSYVEAAVARGEPMLKIWRSDLLPNILPPVLADFGIRFGLSIILVASMNYLGLGLAPPASDWGLMTSENQAFITLNPLSVVAPGVMLAFLSISVNLLADAYLKVAAGDIDIRPSILAKLNRKQRRHTNVAASSPTTPKGAGN
jgi:ABC-type dipeptide/oligopeptide/nickel transport system permease subunit